MPSRRRATETRSATPQQMALWSRTEADAALPGVVSGRQKLRWSIFERDGFTCQYCGRGAPEVTLELDHVQPKSRGGKDSSDNLITACRECNRGKRDQSAREVRTLHEPAWTDEQEAIFDVAARGDSIRITAYAGTGKTSTLVGLARRSLAPGPTGHVLYLGFNRTTAADARGQFGSNTESLTAHALAFRHQRAWLQRRQLVGSLYRLKPRIVEECRAEVERAREASYRDSPRAALRDTLETLQRFCQSDSPVVARDHVPTDRIREIPVPAGVNPGALEAGYRAAVVDSACTVWAHIMKRGSTWPITHDVYLKRFQLGHPALPYDVVLFDEAQDANPVMIGLVQAQAAQQIWVGDPYQQIYSWRGAINALGRVHGPLLPLSHSWRFGPAVAARANAILDGAFGARPLMTGRGPTSPPNRHEAVLCRSNVGALDAALRHMDGGHCVHVVGGGKAIVDDVRAVLDLRDRGQSNHPDLCVFESWGELVDFAETPLGSRWKPVITFISRPEHEVRRACGRLESDTVDEEHADTTVSTVHKAKGREWTRVTLAADFQPFAGFSADSGRVWVWDEEARLWYVACTRAQHYLDLGESAKKFEESLVWAQRHSLRPDASGHLRVEGEVAP